MSEYKAPLRIGVGGPVGSGKTALLEVLCKAMRDHYSIAVVTNDIYTQEDAKILTRAEALPADRIVGVETGGCPHTAIREDASMNLAAVEDLARLHGDLDVVFVESGGDNLSATFSPELADLCIYVIDVAEGEKKFIKATEISMREYALLPIHHVVATWAARKGISYELGALDSTFLHFIR